MNCVRKQITTANILPTYTWLCPILEKTPPSKLGKESYVRFSTAVDIQMTRKRKKATKHVISAAKKTDASACAGDITEALKAWKDARRYSTLNVGLGGTETPLGDLTKDGQARMREHYQEKGLYPRVWPTEKNWPFQEVMDICEELQPGDAEDEIVAVYGRVWTIRKSGNKLWFIDICQDGKKLQCLFNMRHMELDNEAIFPHIMGFLKRGDILWVLGRPHRTSRGEKSVLATHIPSAMSICINQLPEKVDDEEFKMRNRHVDMLLNQDLTQRIRDRSKILSILREFLTTRGHVEVQTPILSANAGGAVARPFFTTATEFPERKLSLRISPELWLKRLIIGGMERVYEIGPSFRNEGIDLTHNPEFWTCEFYRTYTGIDELITMTEELFEKLSDGFEGRSGVEIDRPFPRLDFITTLERESGLTLPDLSTNDAEVQLIIAMQDKAIPIPSKPTLPRLLDKLCSDYIEPLCKSPTWIINPPICLSPLAKSFLWGPMGHKVAARAELFVNHQEIVNTYEEENNPREQQSRFEAQRRYNLAEEIDDGGKIDESYIQALEWGLPPTGGWGCGIERLCMLFGGTKRIADTLTFGSLRNVVSLANRSVEKQRDVSSDANGTDEGVSNGDAKVEDAKQSADNSGQADGKKSKFKEVLSNSEESEKAKAE